MRTYKYLVVIQLENRTMTATLKAHSIKAVREAVYSEIKAIDILSIRRG